MLREFIEYASQTSLPSLGLARLPLDFVVWHQFGENLRTDWYRSVRQARQWLEEFGYPRETLTVVDEWGLWGTQGWMDPARDTERGAAYWATTLFAMVAAGLDRQTVAALQDFFKEGEPPAGAGEFHGDLGLLTKRHVIPKPAYNAMVLSGKLGRRVLASSIRDERKGPGESGIDVIATSENGRVAVLIASYVPDPRRVGWRYLTDRGYRDAAHFGLTAAEFLAYAEGDKVSPRGRRWSEQQAQDLEAARALYQAQKALTRASRVIRLNVRDIPFRRGCLERYVVDSTSGNAPRAWAKVKTQGEEVALEAARKTEKLQPVEAKKLTGESLVQVFSMEPYSVVLVVLSKPEDGSDRCLLPAW